MAVKTNDINLCDFQTTRLLSLLKILCNIYEKRL